MDITLNNVSNAADMILLTDVPNILKVEDVSGGTKATITLTFQGNLAAVTSSKGQWHIRLGNESVTNVIASSDVINRNWKASTTASNTAASVARALRNCSAIYSTWTIRQDANYVYLTARNYGEQFTDGFSEYFETNLSSSYVTASYQDGMMNSTLAGSLIDVDIEDVWDGNFITTLEKTFIDGSVSFNLSPSLVTLAQKGEAKMFKLTVSSFKQGQWNLLGEVEDNWITVGYMCNQGAKYLQRASGTLTLAQNVSRGNSSMAGEVNTMPLYTAMNTFPICFYNGITVGGMTITNEYLDSAGNIITSSTETWRNTDSSRPLKEINGYIPPSLWSTVYYYDITLGNEKLRYRVIKPLNASEGATRILWRNEYGGISFFDFTGERNETRTLEQSTYNKNIYDYYDSTKNELQLQYNADVEYQVTVTSHLLPKDATYIFNSLLQSPYIWTNVNNEDYVILIKSLNIEETDQNDIYKVKLTYTFSQQPSLI